MNRRRTTATTPASAYEHIEAKSNAELRARASGVRNVYLHLTGKHESATYRELSYNFFMEFVSTFILGMIIPIVAFTAGATTSLATGALFGAVYGIAYYVVCMLPRDHKLRCHGNPAVTLGYIFTGDVGIAGLFYYWIAQVIGAMLSGLVVGAILSNQDGGCIVAAMCVVQRAAVPLPVTANGAHGLGVSLTTVICMEIFIPAIIVMILLVSEYLNTNARKEYALISNRRYAVRNAAIATAVFVAVGYPFQIFSFNGATYLAGLFSGALADVTTHFGRAWSNLAYLPITNFLPNSAWDGNTATAALYFLGPLAGAVVGGILTLVAMMLGFLKGDGYKYDMDGNSRYRSERPQIFGEDRLINADMQEPLLHAAQTTHTSVADLINPYQAGGVSKSVL